jgi:hypothetical protein
MVDNGTYLLAKTAATTDCCRGKRDVEAGWRGSQYPTGPDDAKTGTLPEQ